jgi:hypothetical protein
MKFFFYLQMVVVLFMFLGFGSFIMACVNAFTGTKGSPQANQVAGETLRNLLNVNVIFFLTNSLVLFISGILIGLNIP